MAGIYVHIPFCLTRCHYCDFYSVTQTDLAQAFTDACVAEIRLRADYLKGEVPDTIYFGGGTPSLLDPALLEKLLLEIRQVLHPSTTSEVTIEANPDDLTEEKLAAWLAMGFNRISIGLQSFREQDLKLMNRRHSVVQGLKAPHLAFESGFNNISLDLIYGLPDLSIAEWKNNLTLLKELPCTHLSAYHLTYEPGTVFTRWKKQGKIAEPEDWQSLQQYELLLSQVQELGFEHYEISNFARNKQYSRHNIKYWNGESYLGLGPSAHGYNQLRRHWNPPSVNQYIRIYRDGTGSPGEEVITPEMKRNELIMTRLRTIWGIHKDDWEQQVSTQCWIDFIGQAQPLITQGRLVHSENRLKIPFGYFFEADGIIAELFEV